MDELNKKLNAMGHSLHETASGGDIIAGDGEIIAMYQLNGNETRVHVFDSELKELKSLLEKYFKECDSND